MGCCGGWCYGFNLPWPRGGLSQGSFFPDERLCVIHGLVFGLYLSSLDHCGLRGRGLQSRIV